MRENTSKRESVGVAGFSRCLHTHPVIPPLIHKAHTPLMGSMPIKDRAQREAYMKQFNHKHYLDNKDKRKKQIRKRRIDIKVWFQGLKRGLVCIDCGFEGATNPWAIEFDHLVPTDKKRTISRMVSEGRSKESILDEITKCEAVCANCHREREYQRFMNGQPNNIGRSRHVGVLYDHIRRRNSEKRKKREEIAKEYASRDGGMESRPRPSGPKPKPLPSLDKESLRARYAAHDARIRQEREEE